MQFRGVLGSNCIEMFFNSIFIAILGSALPFGIVGRFYVKERVSQDDYPRYLTVLTEGIDCPKRIIERKFLHLKRKERFASSSPFEKTYPNFSER